MSEMMPEYQTGSGSLRHPEYFFIRTPEKMFRIRVPWQSVTAFVDLIECPQGYRTHDISWGHIPGPEKTRQISTAAVAHLLEWARQKGWVE